MSTVTMGSAVAIAAGATKFIYEVISQYQYSCEVIIENQTNLCLYHFDAKDVYGNILTGKLPTVPPECECVDKGETFAFDEAVGLASGNAHWAPCSVLVWKFDKLPSYLVVYAYMGTFGDNAGFFEVSSNVKSASDWYDKNKNNWYKYSEIPLQCDQDFGDHYRIEGTLDDTSHSKFLISILEK